MKLYFDTETTKLGVDGEIIQVGIINDSGDVLFDSLVKCQGEIDKRAQAVHGISKEDLKNAPTWGDIHEQVCNLLSNAKVVKIYNAPFDLNMLKQTAQRYGLSVPAIKNECVMRDYANLYFNGDYVSLVNACGFEQIDVSHLDAHNAVADCNMTRLLDLNIAREKQKCKKRAAYNEKIKQDKLELVPDNPEEFPYFGQTNRPTGYKTLSELKKRDIKKFEFAGTCCDTYGNQGFIFKPKITV